MTILDLISGLRATIELVLWLLIGQLLLGLLASTQRHSNPVFRLFAFLLRPVRWLGDLLWAWASPRFRNIFTFLFFAMIWLALGLYKFTLVGT